jgi:hypothetical protein
MLNRKFLTLPTSLTFLLTPEPIRGYNEATEVAYSPQLVDGLIRDPNVINDLNRSDLRFGKKGERLKFGEFTNVDNYFGLILAEAKKQDTELSLDQVKVLVGYLNSARGQWVQQGITSLPFGSLKAILVAHAVGFDVEGSDVYHRIQIKNNKIHITHYFYAKSVMLAYLDRVANYEDRPLIKKKHEYVLTEENGLYSIELINQKSSILIDKEFYKKDLLPAIRKSISNLKDVENCGEDVVFEIYSYVPFLTDAKIAKMFFAKMVTAPVTSNTTSKKWLSAVQKIKLTEKYISSCFENNPKKKNKLLKQLYTTELQSLIADEKFNKFKRDAARNLLTQVDNLPGFIQKDNRAIITDVLKFTVTNLRHPRDLSNLDSYGITAEKLKKTSWGKKVGAAMMVFLGVALLTVSVIAVVTSFGGSSVLSALGIAVATNLITQTLAVVGSVAGASLAAGGIAYARYSPLKLFYKATQPFHSPELFSHQKGYFEENTPDVKDNDLPSETRGNPDKDSTSRESINASPGFSIRETPLQDIDDDGLDTVAEGSSLTSRCSS